jgi:hypothetical protein
METAINRLEKMHIKLMNDDKEKVDTQAEKIEQQELEILGLKAKVSELQEELRLERLRVKRIDFPPDHLLRAMKKDDLETLRKETYDTWLWGSNTVDHDELAWRLGAIVKAMRDSC